MQNPNLSRRRFLTTAATGAATLLAPQWLSAAENESDARITQLLSKIISVDMHNHVYPAGTEPHPWHDPNHVEPPPDNLFIADEIRRSGLSAVCASFVLDFAQNDKPGDARTNYLSWLTAIDAQLAAGHMRRALNLKDLQIAQAQGQPTIVQTVEGAQFIEGQLDRIAEVYSRGLRHLQLLHMKDDLVSPLGDVITAPAHLGGLSPFGAEVIKECNRLGILVDLAHASPETVQGAIKISTRPILYSHTGLDSRTGKDPKFAAMIKPHLISKENAKVIADSGGVIGVWTKLADSPKEYVENIKAMVDAIGIDHVGIGTDSDLLSSRVGQGTKRSWPSIKTGFFFAVAGEMFTQGFASGEISKIAGGNFCRIFDKATANHA
jgi:membrane dipeptidase